MTVADDAPAPPGEAGGDIDHQARAASVRGALGVTGEATPPPFRRAIRESGVGWYPVLTLGSLVIVDDLLGYGFLVLGPEVAGTLGISKGALAGALALKTLALTIAALPMAATVQSRPRRALVAVVTALAWSVFTGATAFVASVFGLLVLLVLNGVTSASVNTVHPPLLMDSYPPGIRVRAMSLYRAATSSGQIIAPLFVAVLTTVFALTWRGVFLAMGVACLAATLVAMKLRDPGFGSHDEAEARRRAGTFGQVGIDDAATLGFFEIVRRLWLLPTVHRFLVGYAVVGMMFVPLSTYLLFFLDERWNMGPGARGAFYAVLPAFALAALWGWGRWGEASFSADPSRLVRFGALCLGGGVVALALAILSPFFALMGVLLGAAFACFAVLQPCLTTSLLSIVHPRMRTHAAALVGIFTVGVGGLGGLLLLGGIDRRFGTGGAIVALAIPGVVGSLVVRSAAATIDQDLDRLVATFLEDDEVHAARARGAAAPLLACRRLDFAYGQRQVLFGVDFTVREGEMLALLGTNGAGKSTLLRVISGLGLPTQGSVRLQGTDITYVEPVRRVQMGIVQVPGGRAVFGPLTVADNLRLMAYSCGRNRRAVEGSLDRALEHFPQLALRRAQPASTLSGGEQQMLALTKALMLEPKLLLIDELSLGLAPVVVGQLLDVVREINNRGTAVVLVEQSVNIALSLVDHAYFMERGEIRFDGPARELESRPDLLRSVFFEGAGAQVHRIIGDGDGDGRR